MTSSAPLTEWALQVLRDAGGGELLRLDAAAQHDLDAARAMTPAERVAVFDAPMLRAASLGQPAPDREPIRYVDIHL